jgi:hypothetical protein
MSTRDEYSEDQWEKSLTISFYPARFNIPRPISIYKVFNKISVSNEVTFNYKINISFGSEL